MKKTKKILVAFITLIMMLSVLSLSGCGKDEKIDDKDNIETGNDNVENNGADVTDEGPITLTVYSQLANYSGEQIGWFGQIMLDKFNVKLNIVNDEDGVFVTRMESGHLGDIVIFGSDGDQYLQAINKECCMIGIKTIFWIWTLY